MTNPSYRHDIVVTEVHLDGNGHVNNVVYVSWMQDAANAHSNRLGALELVRELGGTWVVRAHRIEYLKQTFSGNRIEVHTWVDSFKRFRSTRCFRFERGDEVVARGETEYVLLDAETGKPRAIPEAVIEMYARTP